MKNITFRLSDLHQHGEAFFGFLRLRKHFFVDELGWDIPHDSDMEMDQYDNPTAHYSLVVHEGRVVGGARTMPTDARWGQHTYMLRDAFESKLEDIPADVMPSLVKSREVWECTRLVVSDSLRTQADRSHCLWLIVNGLVHEAEMAGGREMISLSPLSLVRALRQLGFAARKIGQAYKNDDDGRRYAVLSMPARMSLPAGQVGVPAGVPAASRQDGQRSILHAQVA
jgi:acyl homoserine lactone synthase